jgi:hypothetical protein
MKKDMKWIALICLAGVVGFVGLSTLIAGCGERQENTLYYYGPSWTRAGDVVLIKGLQTVRKDVIGTQLGSSYTESLISMTAAGASESLLLDVTGNPPYGMSAAPAGDYVVYLDGLRSGSFSKAVIINIAAGVHTGLDKVELAFDPGIKSVDWSSDAKKLVYCTTAEVRTVNLDGTGDTLVTAEANLSFVAWKNGTRIAFVHTSGADTLLSLIQADGTGRIDLPAVGSVDKPQIDPNNPNIVWGLSGTSYCSTNVSALTPATAETMANCKADLPRLNQAGDSVIYDKVGEQSGVYLLSLTTKAETKIK